MTEAEPAYCEAEAAYQGAPGAFSEDAARAMLGSHARLLPCRTLEDVFHAVASGRVRSAVVPITNTVAGRVPGCAELLDHYAVHVVDEQTLRIVHALIAAPHVARHTVRRVLSHPVALAQCQRFFRARSHLVPVPAFDTAGAVAEVVRGRSPDIAAIASARAAEIWGGVVLANGIQDRSDNFTTFLRIQRDARRLLL
jgi:prephenate dehydratase